MTLSPALVPLAAYRRFINYTLEPDPDRPGKTIKRPIDVKTGYWCKAIDPAHQYTYAEAAATGRPVGFVFNEADGFWFLDIDACLEESPAGAQWSALAHSLMQRLAGAAIEVSQSGRGLHLFGRGAVPKHSCKNIPLGLELYTHDRFVALTNVRTVGDAGADVSGAISAIAAEYFPPNPHGEIAGWTAEPVEEWSGPENDEELIKIALSSGKRSAGAAFGDKHVTFEDLWTANADALERRWPSDKGGYDASQADAALASHLGFWTGKNCERIRTLMLRSALVRPKWDDRPEWLETTIMRAASVVTNVASGPSKTPSQPPSVGTTRNIAINFDGDLRPGPPRELVKKMLPAEGIAFIGGQSGAGKTFVAVDLAVALASDKGQELFGRRVRERVGVVIVAAEGYGTLPDRLHVAKEHRKIACPLPIACIDFDLNLSSSADATKLCEKFEEVAKDFSIQFGVRLGAIIIDTLAAAFALENENDNAEAAAAIRRLREIQSATGAVIIPVHHYGKSGDTGLRGASALRAGADVVLSVLAERNEITGVVTNRRLALAKSRTREEGPISGFDLRVVPIGFDEDGDVFGSCIVVLNDGGAAAFRTKNPVASHRDLLAAYDATIRDHGVDFPATPQRSAGRAVKLVDLRAEFGRRRYKEGLDQTKQRDAARKAFGTALNALAAEFVAWDDHGYEWLRRINTERPENSENSEFS